MLTDAQCRKVPVTLSLTPAMVRWANDMAAINSATVDEVIGLVARIGISEQIEQFGSPEIQAALREE